MSGDILTGDWRRCRWCKLGIYEVQDPSSFVIDWGADTGLSVLPLNVRLDYGCGDMPLNDDEGTYGHYPEDPELLASV